MLLVIHEFFSPHTLMPLLGIREESSLLYDLMTLRSMTKFVGWGRVGRSPLLMTMDSGAGAKRALVVHRLQEPADRVVRFVLAVGRQRVRERRPRRHRGYVNLLIRHGSDAREFCAANPHNISHEELQWR